MPTIAIPGVDTFHPRSEWEPNGEDAWYGEWLRNTYGDLRRDSAFHRTPRGLWLPGISYIATHYTAAINIPDGDPGEILDGVDGIRALLARSHWDYLTNRSDGGYERLSDGRWFPGYPLGYSFAFDWLGGVWEINGFDYQPAATSGWNNRALAFLMLTDRYDPGSELMWRSHRAVAREAKRRGANIVPERIWSHGWFEERTGIGTNTGCCGDALEAQIRAGAGDFTRDENTGDDMTTLPKPKRIYDSRKTGGVFADGESRQIVVGTTTEAQIGVTVIGRSGNNGYVAVNDQAGQTSIVGWSTADNREGPGIGPVLTPDGKIVVSVHGGTADVVIDVWATKP